MYSKIFPMFGVVTLLVVSSDCFSQHRVRQICRSHTVGNEPIMLVGSAVNGKAFEPENKLLADRDWLRSLKLMFENISNTGIIHFRVSLKVDAQGEMVYPLLIPASYGHAPLPARLRPKSALTLESPRILGSREIATIQLWSSVLDDSTRFLRERGVEEVDRVGVVLDFVLFDDGTGWSKGNLVRQDPHDDTKWEIIGRAPAREFQHGMSMCEIEP